MFAMFGVPSSRQHNHLAPAHTSMGVAQKVTVEADGVDYLWVMQVTFVVTIAIGAPVVAVAAVFTPLPSWGERALFAIRVGAGVWFITAIAMYLIARRRAGAV